MWSIKPTGQGADHLQKWEASAFDTKLIWEQFLEEIVKTRRELFVRLDRIEAIVLETRSGLRVVKDRLEKIETKLIRQA